MKQSPALAPYADTLALLMVVLVITYLTLVIGELVPKRLALQNAEPIAVRAAPLLTIMARLLRPFVSLLSASVSGVMWLLGRSNMPEASMTSEDILHVVREGSASGVVEPTAAALIQQIFRFSDRPIRAIMTPRTEMIAIDAGASKAEVAALFRETAYTRMPVYRGQPDAIIGILHAKGFIRWQDDQTGDLTLEAVLNPVEFVVESEPVNDVMRRAMGRGFHMAIVLDEYGGVAGLITLEDLLEELIGEIRDEYDVHEEHDILQRDDGTWLVDGLTEFERLREVLDIHVPDDLDSASFTTVGGLMMALLRRIPAEGDTVRLDRYVLEVIDMDERRVDKVLVRPDDQ